jgi:hypothetical protein
MTEEAVEIVVAVDPESVAGNKNDLRNLK